jgi:hypothetical protein
VRRGGWGEVRRGVMGMVNRRGVRGMRRSVSVHQYSVHTVCLSTVRI